MFTYPQAKVGGNLIVSATPSMKLTTNIAKFLYKRSFNKAVNVFFARGVKV